MHGYMLRIWLYLSITYIIGSVVEARPPKKGQPKPRPLPEPYLKDQIPPGEAFFQDAAFNAGAYGLYVNRTFKSSPVLAPRINFDKPFSECDDGSYLFLTPRGEVVDPNPVILDLNGSLIWTPGPGFGQVYNLQVQQYRGLPYLTFWGGNNSIGGHGEGTYYMFDQHYLPYRNISMSNNLAADLHSFEILPGGTALISAYQLVNVNLQRPNRRLTRGKVIIWDSLFQEFDMETGDIVFEWRASDHFDFDESYVTFASAKQEKEPWDWFHINMIDKDNLGNYLVSARHLRCIAYISGETGEVLWRLGGKKNSFTDLSDGQATTFVGQHDAHWDEDHKFITIFDNRADWAFELEHVSKGTRIELDLELKTATLNTSFVHPLNIFGFSQGSYQTLPNRNVLLGYGYTGAVAEFAPNGTLLCDAFLGPSARFSSGDVQSYRNLKFNWTGIPLTRPALVLAAEEQTLYMSWHGSTETRSWWLQESNQPNGPFGSVGVFPKTGFESNIPIIPDLPLRQYVRIVAQDKDDRELGISDVVDIGDLATQTGPATPFVKTNNPNAGFAIIEAESEDLEYMLAFGVMVMIVAFLIFYSSLVPRLLARCRRRIQYLGQDGPASAQESSSIAQTFWQRGKSVGLAASRMLWRRREDEAGKGLMSGELLRERVPS